MEFAETDERTMLRTAVRDIAARFGHDYYAGQARSGGRTTELWDAVAAPGFLGVHLPERYGGGGGGMSELQVVCEEVAAQGCPLLLILVSAGISAELIKNFGDDEQKARWLPPLATGTKMVFAITEPDAGSNSHNISTTATRDGDVYHLRGTKTFISGVDEAPAMVVVARTATDERTGRGRLSLLVVDTDAPGLEATPIPVEIAAPEKQYQLFFDDVQVPADRLLGTEGDGLHQVFAGLNPERIMSASICAGIGRYALERAARYANDREVWGVPIGSHQGIAHPLAEAKIELELARLMTTKAAWAHDHETDRIVAGEAANMA
ncbi:MAG TPA: acyl-CoA dehydrogenase, partial [Acidimicrobiia bacterium]|nr:acyl-CoA dehydrogenase [Acidimicrobiia bacterium]